MAVLHHVLILQRWKQKVPNYGKIKDEQGKKYKERPHQLELVYAFG